MIRKQFYLTKKQDKWLKQEVRKHSITESFIIRTLIDAREEYPIALLEFFKRQKGKEKQNEQRR